MGTGKIRRGLSAGSRWPRPGRLVQIADVGFKVAALIAAIIATGLLAAPKVQLVEFKAEKPDNRAEPNNPDLQAFIDVRDLESHYEALGSSAPYVVVVAARDYNEVNEKDLLNGTNESANLYTPAELCSRMPELLLQLFVDADCSAESPSLGQRFSRGRTYERLLLAYNFEMKSPLDVKDLRRALLMLRSSEYLTLRYTVLNDGGGYASNVRISTPEQFLPSPDQPFSLPPHSSYTIRFQTALGAVERDPDPEQLKTATDISWDQGGGVISWGWRTFLLVILLIMLSWTILAEILGARGDKEEERRREPE